MKNPHDRFRIRSFEADSKPPCCSSFNLPSFFRGELRRMAIHSQEVPVRQSNFTELHMRQYLDRGVSVCIWAFLMSSS
jgi:hypothetical protein